MVIYREDVRLEAEVREERSYTSLLLELQAGFKLEKRVMSQGSRCPLEFEKDQKTDSSVESLKGTQNC